MNIKKGVVSPVWYSVWYSVSDSVDKSVRSEDIISVDQAIFDSVGVSACISVTDEIKEYEYRKGNS